jgi:hypothetical protein
VPLDFIKNTLALGTASTMDVVAEHSYSQVEMPEINLPKQTEAVLAVLAANGGLKPIWHTEQGAGGDDDGYLAPLLSEADVASLYVRNLVMTRSLGIEKYFWFSAQTSPTYGWGVFYENYIPRPRLAALDACASFIEGTTFRKAYRPSKNAYAFLFEGDMPVCVVWNMNAPTQLVLPGRPDSLRAFDMMGNALPIVGSMVEIPAERPTYLRCAAGESEALTKALAAAKAIDAAAVAVTVRPAAGGRGIDVTVTGRAPVAQDGVVEVVPLAGGAPKVLPAPMHFHGLASGQSQTLTLPVRNLADIREVRVRVGDREMQEVKTPYPAG